MISFVVINKIISFSAQQPKPVSITNGGSRVSFAVRSGTVNIVKTSSQRNERLQGEIDNVNTNFTTSHKFIENSTQVFINGLLQERGEAYEELGNDTIVFSEPPNDSGFKDLLTIIYSEA